MPPNSIQFCDKKKTQQQPFLDCPFLHSERQENGRLYLTDQIQSQKISQTGKTQSSSEIDWTASLNCRNMSRCTTLQHSRLKGREGREYQASWKVEGSICWKFIYCPLIFEKLLELHPFKNINFYKRTLISPASPRCCEWRLRRQVVLTGSLSRRAVPPLLMARPLKRPFELPRGGAFFHCQSKMKMHCGTKDEKGQWFALKITYSYWNAHLEIIATI